MRTRIPGIGTLVDCYDPEAHQRWIEFHPEEFVTLTDIERLIVFRCHMRGKLVEIQWSDCLEEPDCIVDVATGDELPWVMTATERAALDAAMEKL